MDHKLVNQFPDPEVLKDNLIRFSREETEGFIRLWLSEGIPFAFKGNPLEYESIRAFIANRLRVNPKEITLIGSARIGFSLTPERYGSMFSDVSDYDFSLVSFEVFEKCCRAFERWNTDYECERVKPEGPKQKKYWPSNQKNLPENIRRGFIDPYKIPLGYHPVGEIMNLLYRLQIEFRLSKPSLRVYKDWGAFVRQAKVNVNDLIAKLK